MVTMVDEIYDRAYQSARAELNAGLHGSFVGISKTIGDSLRVLHRMEWSAPWARPGKRARGA